MARYACCNPKCRLAEYIKCWKPPSRLNGFFIWTSIIISVHMESKVKSWILGYGLVAELRIPENLIKPSPGICHKVASGLYRVAVYIILLNGLISLTEYLD